MKRGSSQPPSCPKSCEHPHVVVESGRAGWPAKVGEHCVQIDATEKAGESGLSTALERVVLAIGAGKEVTSQTKFHPLRKLIGVLP